MAYHADIFQQLNKVRGKTIVEFIDTLSASWKNLTIGIEKFKQKLIAMFENLATAAGDEMNVDIASEVVQHLGWLRAEFVLYFPEIINTNVDLVKNPFVFSLENAADCMKDELIDLRNVDSGAKYVFETNNICGFWQNVSDDYPNVKKISSPKVTSLPQYIFM